MKRVIAVIVFLSFLGITSSFAQEGTVRGKVIDANSGEPLTGATVMVKENSDGAVTDFAGKYTLKTEPGTYTIRVSFVSYEKKIFQDVTVKAGEVKVLDANLEKASSTDLEEVVVSAKTRRNTATSMMVVQRKSAHIMNGISSGKISELGDANAAQALKRVTGVSVQEGKYIYVRGLGERYTNIILNDAEIPALDPEKNTVQMDIFPSNIIENIKVNKTFTPDMSGESTGGEVNIVTRDFPEKFTFQFSNSIGYNPRANLNTDFLTYPGGDLDWLGTDDGTRDIPKRAQAALNKTIENDFGQIIQGPNRFSVKDLNDVSKSFNKRFTPTTKKSFLDHSHKLAIGDQISIGQNQAIGYNFALNYSRNFSYYEDGTSAVYEESYTPSPFRETNDRRGKQDVIVSGLANVNVKLSPNHKFGVRYLKTQSGDKIARSQDGQFHYENNFVQDRQLSFIERAMNSYQVHGKHVFPALNNSTIKWSGSYIDMHQSEPDQRFFINLYEQDANGNPSDYMIKTNTKPKRFYRDMQENNIDLKLDADIPVNIGEKEINLKFGGTYVKKDRTLDDVQFELKYDKTDFPTGDINYFLDNYMISENNHGGYYYTDDYTSDLNNSYTANQTVYAGYGMVNFSPFDNLRIITGVRMEKSYIFTENQVSEDSKLYKSGDLNELDLLPSLNATYTIIEKMNLRLALARTLARPVFKEIGTSYYDYKTGIYYQGNPDLKRALVNNIDTKWEYYFDRGERVAVSAFYKNFKNPIEQKLSVSTQNFEILHVNSDNANVYGVEFEFRKKLDFIKALKNYSLEGNLSFVKSSVTIPGKVLKDIRQKDPDKSSTRPMLGQAPYIINAHLNYENTDMKLKSNIGFNMSGEKLLLITKGSTPYIYEQPSPSLNFNISKGLGKHFSIKLSASNLLDSKESAVHHFNEGDRYYYKYSKGREFGISLKYLID